jgi:hypothetical protein
MKQVQVNGLMVYTGPDTDAYAHAADLIRQALFQAGLRFAQVLDVEQLARRVERGLVGSVSVGHAVIRVIPADITYWQPECGHAVYASGTCRKPACENYYLRAVA